MEYLKIKKRIKKFCQAVCVFMLVQAVLCGCGIKSGAESDIKYTPEENIVTNNKENSSENPDKSTGGNSGKTDNDDAYLYKNVPVYGKEQQKEIKKYLASFPDNLTEKEAKEKGIVIVSYGKNKNKFQAIWNGFYKYTMEGEEALSPQDGIIKCYAEPFRAAIVVLMYTIEGDACYTYISFTEDGYYVLADNSRDAYKEVSWDGYSEIGVFKSLRKSEEIVEDEGKKYFNITYSVYKEPNISEKEIRKVTKEDDAYANKYYDVYSYCTYVDD